MPDQPRHGPRPSIGNDQRYCCYGMDGNRDLISLNCDQAGDEMSRTDREGMGEI